MVRKFLILFSLFGLVSCWPDDRAQIELEAEAIEFYESQEKYLSNLKLCKSNSFEDTVIRTNDFYINLNSTLLSKKSIIAAHFISDEHLQISIFLQAFEGKWIRIFTRKLVHKRENYSINLFNSIKTERFNDSKFILVPEGIWRNYYNYVISIDSLDNIRLNTEMIANEEIDEKTNAIFSIHNGGSNIITATEFKLKNNQLKRVYDYTISRGYNPDKQLFSDVSVRIYNDLLVDRTIILKNPFDNWDAVYFIKRAKMKGGI